MNNNSSWGLKDGRANLPYGRRLHLERVRKEREEKELKRKKKQLNKTKGII